MTQPIHTVLIVEDSPAQALALINLLHRHDLNVLSAPDGLMGLSLALHARPDAIVLDLEMPGKNGLEVCQALKANPHTADIPVIMLTAHAEPAVMQMCLEFNATDFIPKDAFSDRVLLETLRQLHILDQPESTPKPPRATPDVVAAKERLEHTAESTPRPPRETPDART